MKTLFQFTTINHLARIRLGLSGKGGLNRYMVADSIYHLSVGGQGWATISRDKLAAFLAVDRRTIIRCINELEEMDLVERYPKKNDGRVRTTTKWMTEVILHPNAPAEMEKKTVSKSHDGGGKTSPKGWHDVTFGGGKMSPNNNRDNYNNNTIQEKFDFLKIPPKKDDIDQRFIERSRDRGMTAEKDGVVLALAARFLNHYKSNGWKIGKVRMVDWGATIDNWMSDNFGSIEENKLNRKKNTTFTPSVDNTDDHLDTLFPTI